jgi:hypothetical protein
MTYICVAGKAIRSLCLFLFSSAVFLLWVSLAAGAGFVLLHLPDVWAAHSDDENTRYAVMSVTAYALIVGVLFLVFTAGSIARLAGAVIAARTAIRHLREMRAARHTQDDPVSAVTLHPAQNTL